MQERTTNNFEENCKLASVACPLIRHGDVAVIGEGRRETRQKQEWTEQGHYYYKTENQDSR